ncbi:hypothetical protein AGMMS49938_12450 [Fibrobacterales bacterium]|nr:hypothetical protein AGMMS49938_12450 [Fibrobacterales bacterium]
MNKLFTQFAVYLATVSLAVFFLGGAAFAEQYEHSQKNDPLQGYINFALQNNPAVQAVQKNYEAAEKRVFGVGTLDYPKLDIGINTDKMEIEKNGIIGTAQLMQMFNFPGTQGAFQNEARAMSKMQLAKVEKSKDSLTAQVKIKWFGLCAAKQKIKYMSENIALLKQMESLARAQVSAGGMFADLLMLQEEILEMEYNLEAMSTEFLAMQEEFNAVLGRSGGDVEVADSLEIIKGGAEQSKREIPMLAMINSENETYKAGADMNKYMGYPMIGLGVQYEKKMFMAMLSVTLPIWRAKTESALAEAQSRSEASRLQFLAVQNMLVAERAMLKNTAENANKKISLLQRQTELAESSYKIALQNFTAGTGSLADMFKVNLKLLDYKKKLIEAVQEYNSAIAELEVIL